MSPALIRRQKIGKAISRRSTLKSQMILFLPSEGGYAGLRQGSCNCYRHVKLSRNMSGIFRDIVLSEDLSPRSLRRDWRAACATDRWSFEIEDIVRKWLSAFALQIKHMQVEYQELDLGEWKSRKLELDAVGWTELDPCWVFEIKFSARSKSALELARSQISRRIDVLSQRWPTICGGIILVDLGSREVESINNSLIGNGGAIDFSKGTQLFTQGVIPIVRLTLAEIMEIAQVQGCPISSAVAKTLVEEASQSEKNLQLLSDRRVLRLKAREIGLPEEFWPSLIQDDRPSSGKLGTLADVFSKAAKKQRQS